LVKASQFYYNYSAQKHIESQTENLHQFDAITPS